MIQADGSGGIHCRNCGAYHHFKSDCPNCAPSWTRASPILPAPVVPRGGMDAVVREMVEKADALRSGPVTVRQPWFGNRGS